MGGEVAVIGAGALGLIATKTFLEDGWTVTTYESRDYVGGLWKDSDDSTISVQATTIFNSSKYRAAVSDFPFADSDDDYPTASQLHEYWKRFADHFRLLPCVKLETKIKSVTRIGKRWQLVAQNSTGEITTEEFDKVCSATGSFYLPRWPKLESLDKFGGKVLHSIDFHGSEAFKNQNVLLVGMHATAQDVANTLSENAKHVYLSHRSGLLLMPRYLEDGSVFDAAGSLGFSFVMAWMGRKFPGTWNWVLDWALQKISRKAYPNIPDAWGLTPAPSIAIATPLMADVLWPHLQSRFAEPVPKITRITRPHSVELVNGRILEDIDSIIYCTGYKFSIPGGMVPEDLDPFPGGSTGQAPNLYRNIFPLHPDEAIRNSFAYLGQSSITFPGFVQFELCAMAISQTWLGNSPLPPYKAMLDWRNDNLAEREAIIKKYNVKAASTFYPSFVKFGEQFRWLDETAGTGLYKNLSLPLFNRNAWSLWWQDKELYHLCMNGIFTPTVWRLFEQGKRKALPKEECRAMIVDLNAKAQEQKRRRLESKKEL